MLNAVTHNYMRATLTVFKNDIAKNPVEISFDKQS